MRNVKLLDVICKETAKQYQNVMILDLGTLNLKCKVEEKCVYEMLDI